MDLESETEKQAIAKLLIAANHMPYKTWENFQKRGYEILTAEEPDEVKSE
jgi:hypothetical protein